MGDSQHMGITGGQDLNKNISYNRGTLDKKTKQDNGIWSKLEFKI